MDTWRLDQENNVLREQLANLEAETQRLREQLAQREREWIAASHGWGESRERLYERIAELESQQVRWPEPHPYPAEVPETDGWYLTMTNEYRDRWVPRYWCDYGWNNKVTAWIPQPPAYVPPTKSVVEQAAEIIRNLKVANAASDVGDYIASTLDAEGLLRKDGE